MFIFKLRGGKLRHKILDILLEKQKDVDNNPPIKEIALSVEDIAKKLRVSAHEVFLQMDILVKEKEVYQEGTYPNQLFFASKGGSISFSNRKYLKEHEKENFEKFKRQFSYLTIPIGLLIGLMTLFNRCGNTQNSNKINDLEKSVIEIQEKLNKEILYNNQLHSNRDTSILQKK